MNGLVLCGEPGSGKTTIARGWANLHDGVLLSFAGRLKEELARGLAQFDNMGPHGHLARMRDPETKDRYRAMLQALGSFRRAQDERYWVVALASAMEPFLRNGTPIVIDDARYANEALWLRSIGFKFVRLDSGETTRPLTAGQATHESEQDWPHFEFDLHLPYQAGPGIQARRLTDLLEG